jgi:hypothetical protein
LRILALVDTLVNGQRKLGSVRIRALDLGREEGEENGGFVVVLEDLSVERELRSSRSGGWSS